MRDSLPGATGLWPQPNRAASKSRFSGVFNPFFLGLFLAVCFPWCAAVAQETASGDYQIYQKAFAEVLAAQGAKSAATGPVWIQSKALDQKEACITCHLGVTDNRFLYARLPYRRHSGHYLEDHPPQRFGCTVCHSGVGGGLTFAAAGHPSPDDPARRKQWVKFYGWRSAETEAMVPLKSIAGRCVVCHSASKMPHGAEPYQQARLLVADKQCSACHRFRDQPVKHVRQAVHLQHLGSKVGGDWLGAYLKAPHAFRPDSAMPAYHHLQEQELQTLSAYLLGLKDPQIGWTREDPSGNATAVKRGLQVVRERRCQTCHDIPGLAESGFLRQRKVGPSLARVGEKLNPAWIRRWIANPHAVRPETGMPRFRLKAGEVNDITAFLSSLRSKSATPAAPAAFVSSPNAAQAAQVTTKYGCTSCHVIAGLPSDPRPRSDLTRIAPELFARLGQPATELKHLEGPTGLFHRGSPAPLLFAPGEAVDPVLTFLAGEVDLPISHSFRLSAEVRPAAYQPTGPAGKLVQELRCLSCHTIRGTGGEIGPDLTFAGSKLNRKWLIDFLQSPQAIRPMNRARMPQLGLTSQETETLADWIVSELKAPEVQRSKLDLDLAFSFVGASKIKSPYGCITCHRIGAEGGAVGPELTHVGSRLKTKWIYHWIRDPHHWIPDVRMPTFEMNEEDRLAITRYLSEQK